MKITLNSAQLIPVFFNADLSAYPDLRINKLILSIDVLIGFNQITLSNFISSFDEIREGMESIQQSNQCTNLR